MRGVLAATAGLAALFASSTVGAAEQPGGSSENPAFQSALRQLPGDTERIVDDPSGVVVAVENNGTCGAARAFVVGAGEDGDEFGTRVTYRVDESCNVVDVKISRIPAADLASTGDGPLKPNMVKVVDPQSWPEPALKVMAGDASMAPATVWGNYIHSSGTLQDIVTVDIARVRYHTDRKWDGTISWWGSAWAGTCNAGANTPWNHLVSCVAWDLSDYSSIVETAAKGAFHSDWLWCNLQAGQNFEMINDHQSAWQGSYAAFFYQTKTCSGTHMSTDFWTSTNING